MLRITRREFLKYCSIAAGALGLSAGTLMKLENAIAGEANVDVMWLDGAACTGCSVSLLNSRFYTTIDDLLINRLDLNYHKTIMAAAGAYVNEVKFTGANALDAAREMYNAPAGTYVLVVEGAVQCATPPGSTTAGDYCHVGNLTGAVGVGETMLANTRAFASKALAVLAVGTCASFGGIPNGRGSLTNAKGLLYQGTSFGKGALNDSTLGDPITTPVINIPGCPPHPDWIVGTIAHILDTGTLPPLINYRRPVDYGYGEYQCNAGPCPWKYNNAIGSPDQNPRYPVGDSKRLGREKWTSNTLGCLGILGCKGRKTKADCSRRRWNTNVAEQYGVNWCVGSRGNCHGCTEPTFPDRVGKFNTFA